MRVFTKNGYQFGECTSAMQKCIRRAMADEAVFWALELYAKFDSYVPSRLRVIACEDIGMADLPLVQHVLTQMVALPTWPISREEKARFVGATVRQMALCPKSRETDDFGHHVRREMRLGTIPRYTNGMRWPDIAAMLEDAIEAGDEKKTLAICVESLNGFASSLWDALIDISLRRFSESVPLGIAFGVKALIVDLLKRKGSYECVPLSMIVLLLCRSNASPVAGRMALDVGFQVLNGHKRQVPDFAFDKHTARGKAMGRTIQHFNDDGTMLVNEAYPSAYTFLTEDGCGTIDADGNKVKGIWNISDHLIPLGVRPEDEDVELQPALF